MTEFGVVQYVIMYAILAASIYGMIRVFKSKVPLYFMLYICGVWCYAIDVLYIFLIIICGEVYNEPVSLTFLGIGGMFVFFTSANICQINSMIGEKKKNSHNIMANIISLIVAIIIAALIVLEMVFSKGFTLFNYIATAIALFPVPVCAYFCTKYLLIKSDGNNMLKAIKPLNLSTLLICFTILLYYFFVMKDNALWMTVSYIIYSACIVAEVFLADWGRKQWLK